ncbi:hypothetical protein Golomagni_04722 [Golovinomyces magnicellulatus]|nr:hypothetical protein Golomagni_04722 [Golovinomyces magnicellulatus]
MDTLSDTDPSATSSPLSSPSPTPVQNTSGKTEKISIPLKKNKIFFSISGEEIDLSKQPNLNSSRWSNPDTLASLKKPDVTKPINFVDTSNFSDDAVRGIEFAPEKQKERSSVCDGSRKRSTMASPTTEYSSSKAIRVIPSANNTRELEPLTFEDVILNARDNLVRAYSLSKDRTKQKDVLDLLDVFRFYMEKGEVRPPKSNLRIYRTPQRTEDITTHSPKEAAPLIPRATANTTEATAPEPLWTTISK